MSLQATCQLAVCLLWKASSNSVSSSILKTQVRQCCIIYSRAVVHVQLCQKHKPLGDIQSLNISVLLRCAYTIVASGAAEFAWDVTIFFCNATGENFFTKVGDSLLNIDILSRH